MKYKNLLEKIELAKEHLFSAYIDLAIVELLISDGDIKKDIRNIRKYIENINLTVIRDKINKL